MSEKNEVPIGNGYTLFWKDNEVGGRIYISDEVGGGVHVWDTSLVSLETWIAAVHVEMTLLRLEKVRVFENRQKVISQAKQAIVDNGHCLWPPHEYVRLITELLEALENR